MLEAQEAQRGWVERQVAGEVRFAPKPARRQHAQQVAARKYQNGSIEAPKHGEGAIRAARDIGRRLASGAPVPEQVPGRSMLAYLDRRLALVLPVIPLEEIVHHRSPLSESRELASPPRPSQRTHENTVNLQGLQPLAQACSVALTLLSELKVGPTGMLPGLAPGGLTVTN
jgi:hypothetical protein